MFAPILGQSQKFMAFLDRRSQEQGEIALEDRDRELQQCQK
ncbi:MAG: hypothetical protein SW833_02550 [Cyanobacteriota bacterium]|nr:hypothetical protein [Cyanobacteriota bacterium]